MEFSLRPEQPGDAPRIHSLTRAAFEPVSYSDGTEAPIIDDLRAEADLTLSIVATVADDIVGHIALSPVTIDGQHRQWFGLGPVSVRPDLQGKGIGAALVNESLSILRSNGAEGCVLVGDPRYYGRFGFRSNDKLSYRDLPTAVIQSLSFGDEEAVGKLVYSPAFERR